MWFMIIQYITQKINKISRINWLHHLSKYAGSMFLFRKRPYHFMKKCGHMIMNMVMFSNTLINVRSCISRLYNKLQVGFLRPDLVKSITLEFKIFLCSYDTIVFRKMEPLFSKQNMGSYDLENGYVLHSPYRCTELCNRIVQHVVIVLSSFRPRTKLHF